MRGKLLWLLEWVHPMGCVMQRSDVLLSQRGLQLVDWKSHRDPNSII